MLALFFALNAIFHVIQLPIYGVDKMNVGTLIWGWFLAVLGYLWFTENDSLMLLWVSFLMPLIGGVGLFFQRKDSPVSNWINYGILWLDASLVVGLGLALAVSINLN